ncbi:MAG: nicotinate phosphoribosyltransferase [Gammaproteobacteria bacterium]
MNYTPLLTDLYQFTMAYGYWQLGMHEQNANFHLFFRKNPFKGNYALSCGLGSVVEFLEKWRFESDQLDYLKGLKSPDEQPLFSDAFLDYLANLKFSCDLEAVPEGTIVFPNIPLIRIQGPLLQCQLLETPLLNMINFQTLVATKAARVCLAAEGDPVIEFGMRRAQGPDGALSASRAAYIGGCVGTSNTLAGQLYDIPVRGTHAHSWVTAFPDEKTAFTAYAKVMPHNSVLLVDTYNTLQGVKNAIEVGLELRQNGDDLLGIRLDSGDMAELSIQARKLLDDAGFEKTVILASNTLDEYVITDLKKRGAKISAWGVGTSLVTAYDQPALDGVYKLSALQNKEGVWEHKLKLSEQPIKTSNPGQHQVRRFFKDGLAVTDVIYDIELGIDNALFDYDDYMDLLTPVFQHGQLVTVLKSIHVIREEAKKSVDMFINSCQDAPHSVVLEKSLSDLKLNLINRFAK